MSTLNLSASLEQWLLSGGIGPAKVRGEFISAMAAQLDVNAHKGDWSAWKPDAAQLSNEIEHHWQKLWEALALGDTAKISKHSTAMANFCMKAHECFGVPPVAGKMETCKHGVSMDKNCRECQASVGMHFLDLTLPGVSLPLCAHGNPPEMCIACNGDECDTQEIFYSGSVDESEGEALLREAIADSLCQHGRRPDLCAECSAPDDPNEGREEHPTA